MNEEAEKDIRGAIVEHWPAGLESKEAEDVAGGAKEYRLLEDPWTRSRRGDGSKRPMVAAQILASRVLLALNRRGLNLYARVCLRRGEADQVTLLLFRQSNVAYTETLTIQPTGEGISVVAQNRGKGSRYFGGQKRSACKSPWPGQNYKDIETNQQQQILKLVIGVTTSATKKQ